MFKALVLCKLSFSKILDSPLKRTLIIVADFITRRFVVLEWTLITEQLDFFLKKTCFPRSASYNFYDTYYQLLDTGFIKHSFFFLETLLLTCFFFTGSICLRLSYSFLLQDYTYRCVREFYPEGLPRRLGVPLSQRQCIFFRGRACVSPQMKKND